jgi:hypothetical protein
LGFALLAVTMAFTHLSVSLEQAEICHTIVPTIEIKIFECLIIKFIPSGRAQNLINNILKIYQYFAMASLGAKERCGRIT